MNTSFLYHAFGVREQECTRICYENSSIILNIQTRSDKLCCPCCGSRHIVKSGVVERDIQTIPIGVTPVVLRVKVQRIECKTCRIVRQEHLHFVKGKCSYTNRLRNLVVSLSHIGTIQDIARFLHLSWGTVKEIQKAYLERHYGNPSLEGVCRIGIDEFAIRKGHIYKTIVVDLDTGRVVYIGDGKDAKALDGFWKKVRRRGLRIEAVATDLSAAFIASVHQHAPEATLVFDHFHVVKLMNEKIDDIRRAIYRDETDINKREVLKGSRWLLLRHGADIFDLKHKNRLENALALNKDLYTAYYLKEGLGEIWAQVNKEEAERVLLDWVQQARDSKVPKLITMSNTLMAHRTGILAWYDFHISTGKVEGINNKIKTMKRKAYGYRDERFFDLKVLSIHAGTYAFL